MGRPLKACMQPWCPELITTGAYCETHTKPNNADSFRGGSTERGYGSDWRKFRAWFIKQHPLCEDCLIEGRYTAVEEVHHIAKLRDNPALRLVESNCMALCGTHHKIRTARGE